MWSDLSGKRGECGKWRELIFYDRSKKRTTVLSKEKFVLLGLAIYIYTTVYRLNIEVNIFTACYRKYIVVNK